MKQFYKVQYYHRNWGWDTFKTGITKDKLDKCVEEARNQTFMDAYHEPFKTTRIRVFVYTEPKIIMEIEN